MQTKDFTVDLSPRTHDPGVVESDDDNEINTLGGKLLDILNVRRQVTGLAAWRESTRNGDDDDLFAFELLRGIVGLGNATGRGIRILNWGVPGTVISRLFVLRMLAIGDGLLEFDAIRELVAHFELADVERHDCGGVRVNYAWWM